MVMQLVKPTNRVEANSMPAMLMTPLRVDLQKRRGGRWMGNASGRQVEQDENLLRQTPEQPSISSPAPPNSRITALAPHQRAKHKGDQQGDHQAD